MLQKYHEVAEKGLFRHHFPDSLRGVMAQALWNNLEFKYGMEYGYLVAMYEIFGEQYFNEDFQPVAVALTKDDLK